MEFTSSRHLKPTICAALAAIVTTMGVNAVVAFAVHDATRVVAAAPDGSPVVPSAAALPLATEPGRAAA